MQVGELLYEYTVRMTGLTEYGASFGALMAGEALAPEGARFDVHFEGEATGGKLTGQIKGVDYLRLRADGRFDLHIHAEVTTPEGLKIAVEATGVCLPEPGNPVAQLRENVTLFSGHPEYAWVNPLQVWATGTVNIAEGVINIKGYLA